MKRYWVYTMTNNSRTLYTGMTNDLARRVSEHRGKRIEGFTKRYNITQLAYCEEHREVSRALEREKQIKDWARARKIELREGLNRAWRDLGDEVFGT